MKIFIGICSGQAPHLAQRRDWCRRTWLDGRIPSNVRWGFFVGGGMPDVTEADVTYLPCRDDASGCSDKTKAIARAALASGADRLVRTCDDTYLCLSRLSAHPLPGDYGGHVLAGKTYCSGGAGYWLSRRAMRIVAEGLPGDIYAEDLAVEELLLRHGVRPVDDQRFRSWYPEEHRSPRPDNDIVSTHALRTWELFDEVHRGWTGG